MRDLFFYYFQIQESDSSRRRAMKLERGIVGLTGESGQELAHYIGHLLGFDFSESAHLLSFRGDPRALRARAFDAVVEFFGRLAGSAQLLFLSRTCTGQTSSLDLFRHFREQGSHLPCVVIGTARPVFLERAGAWESQFPDMKILRLEPLSEQDSRRLAREILQKVSNLPLALEEMIVQNADGNPFYLEELVKMLIENGSILKREDEWGMRRGESEDPARATHADWGAASPPGPALACRTRAVAARASVIGRVFWDDALAWIEQEEPALGEIRTLLQRLTAKELVYRRQQSAFAGAEEYLFRHALFRDVVYEQTLKAQRRAYHRAAARWLLHKSGERAQEYAGVLAEHFDHAGDHPGAARSWALLRRAERYRDVHVRMAAFDYLQRALALMAARRRRPAAGDGL